MADDAFSYMPPFGKPVSGKAATQDTAEMKFAGRTNIKHSWESDRRRTFIYEPAGEAHTLVITDDSPEPMVTLFIVGGGLIYLDKAENGAFAAYEDGFSILELCRRHYRQTGLDVRQLDLLVR